MGNTQNIQKKINEDSKEDTFTNHDIESYIMRRPYVIIVGIAEYKKPLERLRAIPKDIDHMKQLWLNKFKYDSNYVSIITEDIKSEYVTSKSLNEQLSKIRGKLNQEMDEYKEWAEERKQTELWERIGVCGGLAV